MSKDTAPLAKFQNELLSVFMRWYEESDLDESDMEEAAHQVIDQFCGTSLDFEADFDPDS
tara:strand:+ start:513 stop:692 length:180 start_codon:yes stop_codon:yes gene_type:complete